jgi:putative FmdB family regulatory protein
VYEYRCLECDRTFDQRRPMGGADGATCPAGHARVKRLLSVFAAARGAAAGPAPTSLPTGGGCCGGACGCG